MTRVTAKECEFDVLLTMQRNWEVDNPECGFAGSTHWCRAAAKVLPRESLVPIVFVDRGDAPVGTMMLVKAKADWRSGSPGREELRWPFQQFGYHFAPVWDPDVDDRRKDWLLALSNLFPDAHFALERCTVVSGSCPESIAATPGASTWSLAIRNGLEDWLATLKGEHRRDLQYYRKRIEKSDCDWEDVDATAKFESVLPICFDLHERRVRSKGMTSAYLTPDGRAFLTALIEIDPSTVRISRLCRNNRVVASNLSFVHDGHYRCFMPGWDPAERRLDLGRQVIYHQILEEFERGLSMIDLLGGDHAYKREFGLVALPTINLQTRPSRGAAARKKIVDGALHLFRKIRRS